MKKNMSLDEMMQRYFDELVKFNKRSEGNRPAITPPMESPAPMEEIPALENEVLIPSAFENKREEPNDFLPEFKLTEDIKPFSPEVPFDNFLNEDAPPLPILTDNPPEMPFLEMPINNTSNSMPEARESISDEDEFLKLNPDLGYLIVSTSRIDDSFPVPNVSIFVTRNIEGNDFAMRYFETDINGKSEQIALPAPDRTISNGSGKIQPHATYNLKVRADGYQTVKTNNIQIFGGQLEIVPIDMIPLSNNK